MARVGAIAARLGVDLAAFGRTGAVIVGSNGKGSTAAMTAALLGAHGPVGLFTSPHLLRLNERFRIDDEDIEDAALAQHWARVEEAVAASGEEENLGGFEFLFLIAADWFAARGCVHTVWEAGIGGRLDPVRLIAARVLALTSLDLEHTALLGDALEAIAAEKLGAASRGARVFAPRFAAALQAHLAELAAAQGVEIAFTAPLAGDTALPGAFQQDNAALALHLAQALAPVSAAEVAQGLARVRWPGRLEVLARAPLTVVDVGHTPAAVAAARAGFAALAGDRRPRILVCGASQDKPVASLIAALAPGFDVIVATRARHKGAPEAQVAAHAQDANPSAEIIISPSVAEARDAARARAGGGAIFAAGGLFLAAEFRCVHLGLDPATLAFF
ncbi:MAG: hypothetical protein KF700_05645 [Hyphomonadaceae bacterium]|nr:hypothetical protein [Hyphomonadaceae bacterium]